MPSKPSMGTKEKVSGKALASGTLGITPLMTGTLRRVAVVHAAQLTTGAHNRILFVAGTDNPKITYVGFCAGTAMYHAAAEADTWRLNLLNRSRGLSLNAKSASLSGITLAVTSFKSIALNMGNSTLRSGDVLQLQIRVSGTPQTLVQASMVIHWVPTSSA